MTPDGPLPLTQTIEPADEAAVAAAVREALRVEDARLPHRRRHAAGLRRAAAAAGHRALAGPAQPPDRLPGRPT